MDHTFAIVTRDALWLDGEVLEERMSSGVAEQLGTRIDANDSGDRLLQRSCDAVFNPLRAIGAAFRGGRVRAVGFARRVRSAHGEEEFVSAALTVTIDGVSVVTDAGHFQKDVELLEHAGRAETAALPLVWTNGSASVLLHEAVGHAAEEAAAPLPWPQWLRVRDEPEFRLDDAGNIARSADLLHEPPPSMRRATFRDVPIPRMTRVVVHANLPFELPDAFIEVQLASGGHYDPLTDEVTVTIARAARIAMGTSVPLRPFTLRASREHVLRSLRGANGVPVRYPGVVCSADGQKLIVGSSAPTMLTELL